MKGKIMKFLKWILLRSECKQPHVLVGVPLGFKKMAFIAGCRCYKALLCFQKHKLWSLKAAFTIAFFTAINHNYDHKQQTLKQRNTQNGSKSTNHKSQGNLHFKPVEVNYSLLRGPQDDWQQQKMQTSVSFLTSEFACFGKAHKDIFLHRLKIHNGHKE